MKDNEGEDTGVYVCFLVLWCFEMGNFKIYVTFPNKYI